MRIDTSLLSHTRSVHFTAPKVGLQPISYLFLAFIHSWEKFRHQIQTLLLCSLYSLFVDDVSYIYLNPISLDQVIALLQSENIYDKQSCLSYLYSFLRRSTQHPQFTHFASLRISQTYCISKVTLHLLKAHKTNFLIIQTHYLEILFYY